MKLNRKYILIFLILCMMFSDVQAMDTFTGTFRQDVRSLRIRNADYFMGVPVIRLGTNDRIDINFDIIGEENEYLRYRLIHCNADWNPSCLMESEYLGSFNEAEVDDYAYSTNTYVHYVNYNIQLPSEEMPILRSGNYLLQVYPEHQPDDIILQARFSVSENSAVINGGVTTRTDKGFNSEFQQVYLELEAGNIPNLNPYQDLIVTVEQNNRPETVRYVTHPMRVEGGKVIFDHDMNLIFDSGNEYRRFETVRTDYAGMHVDSVKFGGSNWHAWLRVDESRAEKGYVYDSTQHGRFMIDEYNSTDPDLSADYVTVHFTLDIPTVIGGSVFVDGDFTNHKFNEANLMKYDFTDGLYHAQIPLKQGSYNYQYVVLPEDGGKPVVSAIEGNKYETRNEYLVRVYIRQPGSRADRLIGFTVI